VQGPRPVQGSIVVKTGPLEKKSAKRYLRYTASYRDIPYQIVDQRSWRREEDGNIYLGLMRRGTWAETVELPADVSIGREWEHDDGEKSTRLVTRMLEIELPSGEILPDCIEVLRTFTHNENLASLVDKNYYCKGVGDGGSIFVQPSPVGEYQTKTRVRSFDPGTVERSLAVGFHAAPQARSGSGLEAKSPGAWTPAWAASRAYVMIRPVPKRRRLACAAAVAPRS
jgi:hypothetical protein